MRSRRLWGIIFSRWLPYFWDVSSLESNYNLRSGPLSGWPHWELLLLLMA